MKKVKNLEKLKHLKIIKGLLKPFYFSVYSNSKSGI